METIKVKRSPESKGRCKLAWNKVYTAYRYDNMSKYEVGKQLYPASWFTIVADPMPKSKPIVMTDPQTGKFKVEISERDWSVPKAFPRGYVIPKGVEVVVVKEERDTDNCNYRRPGLKGVTTESDDIPFCDWEDGRKRVCMAAPQLAPLNPTDHPEHPEFGKVKHIEIKPEPIDIRKTIAQYVKKYGHELTAIELIGHLTIDEL